MRAEHVMQTALVGLALRTISLDSIEKDDFASQSRKVAQAFGVATSRPMRTRLQPWASTCVYQTICAVVL